MQTVSTIDLDIAKSVFQVHGVDADGLVVIRSWRSLRSGRLAWSASRPVPRHTIGRASCRHSATPCG